MNYHVIGVMSGTSLDGVDLAYIQFTKNTSWGFNILKAETVQYTAKWTEILSTISNQSLENVKEIDISYTAYLAEIIKQFIKKHRIELVDVVCSHGHTVFHQPQEGFTYQIGNRRDLYKHLGITVVCDFRKQDVEMGGQGAPLVPIGDALLFGEYDFCLNLGGFSNVSFAHQGKRMAFDVCAVNIILNALAKQKGTSFDKDGIWASKGKLIQPMLSQLNQLPYYKQNSPKSLGKEWSDSQVWSVVQSYNYSTEDKLYTYIQHIVFQLKKALEYYNGKTLYLTGGGTFNKYLVNCLSKQLDLEIIKPCNQIIAFKEALIFGLLGVLRLKNETNCLASVTGASSDHSSGIIWD